MLYLFRALMLLAAVSVVGVITLVTDALYPEPSLEDDLWQVRQLEGQVYVAGSDFAVSRNHQFEGGLITTGANSSALLVRGDQRIHLGSGARIVIGEGETAGSTKIIQTNGRAIFKVDRRKQEHFEVRTQQVAAVVKGTEFEVITDKTFHEVLVLEGLVEVTSATSGVVQSIPGGRGVTSTSDGRLEKRELSDAYVAKRRGLAPANEKTTEPEQTSHEQRAANETAKTSAPEITFSPATMAQLTVPATEDEFPIWMVVSDSVALMSGYHQEAFSLLLLLHDTTNVMAGS